MHWSASKGIGGRIQSGGVKALLAIYIRIMHSKTRLPLFTSFHMLKEAPLSQDFSGRWVWGSEANKHHSQIWVQMCSPWSSLMRLHELVISSLWSRDGEEKVRECSLDWGPNFGDWTKLKKHHWSCKPLTFVLFKSKVLYLITSGVSDHDQTTDSVFTLKSGINYGWFETLRSCIWKKRALLATVSQGPT